MPSSQIEMISGSKLRTLRQKRGVSIKSASIALGMSDAQLSRIETGLATPNLNHLAALADYYRVPIHSMLENSIASEAITVQGAVAFGKKVTEPMWPQDQWFTILVHASTKYPGVAHRVLLMYGSAYE